MEQGSTLQGRVAVITGGARGIGLQTARLFASQGAYIVIWDVMDEKGRQAVEVIRGAGGQAEYHHVDVTDRNNVENVTQQVVESRRRIDILINNAGITKDATLAKMSAEQWQSVLDVNLSGVFHCAQCIAPVMAANGYGRIVNASSIVGLYGNFGQTNYVATKSAVIGMTKVWAKELGKKGITVNAVAPGFIATDMIDTIPEKVLAMLQERTALGRMGTAEEVAKAYLFLASDAASFITGIVLSVDGGLVI